MKLPLKFKLWRRWNRLHVLTRLAIGVVAVPAFLASLPLLALWGIGISGKGLIDDLLDPNPPQSY